MVVIYHQHSFTITKNSLKQHVYFSYNKTLEVDLIYDIIHSLIMFTILTDMVKTTEKKTRLNINIGIILILILSEST